MEDFENELSWYSGSRISKLKQVSITYSMAVSPYLSLLTAEGRQGEAGAEIPRGE